MSDSPNFSATTQVSSVDVEPIPRIYPSDIRPIEVQPTCSHIVVNRVSSGELSVDTESDYSDAEEDLSLPVKQRCQQSEAGKLLQLLEVI